MGSFLANVPVLPPYLGSFSKTNPPNFPGLFGRNYRLQWQLHQKICRKTVGSFRRNTCFCRPRLLAGVAALGERGSFRRFSPCSRGAPCPESFRGESPCCLRIAGPAPIARSGQALRLPLHWRGPPYSCHRLYHYRNTISRRKLARIQTRTCQRRPVGSQSISQGSHCLCSGGEVRLRRVFQV